jgi:hypothetical protein
MIYIHLYLISLEYKEGKLEQTLSILTLYFKTYIIFYSQTNKLEMKKLYCLRAVIRPRLSQVEMTAASKANSYLTAAIETMDACSISHLKNLL